MSKRNSKYQYSLPKHQKKIVLHLAKNEPMTMSETNRKIKGEATSTNRAFHELEKKDMIGKKEPIQYHGRRFWKYWLLQKGIVFALLNGSNPNLLRNLTQEVSKNDKEKRVLEIYFELRSISPQVAVDLDKILLHAPNLEPRELLMELINSVSRAFFLMTDSEERKFHSILNASDELRDAWKEFLTKLQEFSKKELENLGGDD